MTAPLSKAPSAPRAAAPERGTGPMAGSATGALPKATVKLQQTQPMARSPMAAPPSAPVKRAAAADSQQFYEDEKDPEAGLVGMSVLCLVAAVVLLAVQMLGSDKVMSAPAWPGFRPHGACGSRRWIGKPTIPPHSSGRTGSRIHCPSIPE